MSVLSETLAKANDLFNGYNVLKERIAQTQQEAKELRNENTSLSGEVSRLSERVAVLEEARKTTAAEVKAAMTEALSAWERERFREQFSGREARPTSRSAK